MNNIKLIYKDWTIKDIAQALYDDKITDQEYLKIKAFLGEIKMIDVLKEYSILNDIPTIDLSIPNCNEIIEKFCKENNIGYFNKPQHNT